MNKIAFLLLTPPVAFLVLLAIIYLFSQISKNLAIKGTVQAGKQKPYACGENVELNKVQPDYDEFFPMAFFFTIMHVVVLILATFPGKALLFFPFLYLLIAVLALMILFRRKM